MLDNVELVHVGVFFRTADAAATEMLYLCGITASVVADELRARRYKMDVIETSERAALTGGAELQDQRRL